MQQESFNPEVRNQHSSDSNLVVSIPSSFYYSLTRNNRGLLQTGPLNLFLIQENDRQILSFQVGHFYVTVNQAWKIVKNQYKDVAGYYLIDPHDSLYCLIVEKSNSDRLNFEGYLKQAVPVIEITDVDRSDRVKGILEDNWKEYASKPPVNADGFQKFISSAGHAIGKGIVAVTNKMSGYWRKSQAPQAPEVPQVSEQEPWFDRFKEKTTSFLAKTGEVVNSVVDPIVRKGREVNGKIGDKIDQSDSEAMKYVKDVASLTTEAVKNIFYGAKAAIRGKQTFYSEENALANHRKSNPQKPDQRKPQIPQNPSSLDLIQRQGIKQELLEK